MSSKQLRTSNKPVAIFDIDGTIFRNSLLIELHWKMVRAGIIPKAAIKKLDRRYWDWVRRKGHYNKYLWEVIVSFDEFVAGVPVNTIKKLARKVVKTQSEIVYRSTREIIEKLRATHTLVAISGSPEIVVAEFARHWKFDCYIGTEHEIKSGYFTGNKVWVASEDKQEALRRLQAKYGFTVGRGSVGVGDTETDVKILSLVDRPICINPTVRLYKVAAKKGWEVFLERKDAIYEVKRGKIKLHGER